MKFSISLFVILSIICLIQAHHLKVTLKTLYDSPTAALGELALTLEGETQGRVLVPEETKFYKHQEFVFETDFPEDVLTVSVDWESDQGEPLFLEDLSFTVDENDSVNFLKNKVITSATREVFHN